MKKLILSLLILIAAQVTFAQADSSFNFLKFTSIPEFSIAKAPDSVTVTNKDIVKRGHCFMLYFLVPIVNIVKRKQKNS